MLDRLLSSSFYAPPMGSSKGYPPPIGPMMMSLHFLPRLLPPPGEPTNQGCSRPDAILRMRYAFGQDLLQSFISLSASEGNTTPFC